MRTIPLSSMLRSSFVPNSVGVFAFPLTTGRMYDWLIEVRKKVLSLSVFLIHGDSPENEVQGFWSKTDVFFALIVSEISYLYCNNKAFQGYLLVEHTLFSR